MSSKAHGNQKTAAAQAEYRRAVRAARQTVVRSLAEARTLEERQLALRKMRSSQKSWSAELKYQIWLMSLKGMSAAQIAAQFGLHPGTVKNLLSELRRERTRQTAEMIDAHRMILLSRAEMIVERFMPVALDPDLFGRLERGEPVSETVFERAFRSALILLAVANFQCRLLGLFNSPHGRKPKTKTKAEGRIEDGANVWWPSKMDGATNKNQSPPGEDELTFCEEIPERRRS
jgi:DNA-binding CsgD family transcriptional regulator